VEQQTAKHIERVVREACDGSREAFRVLYDILNDKLFVYASSRVSDRERALDLVQETFVALWEQLPKFTYHGEGAFYSFVYTILKRKMARGYEHEKRDALSLDERMETLGDADLELSHIPHYEDYRYLARVIGDLPDGAREVIALRYWSQFSFKEIADALDITETTAKVRHHRAMKTLREQLENKAYGPE